MKAVAGVIILAIVLVGAGVVGLSEARLMRQMVAEQQRLATLHYDDEGVPNATLLNRLSLPFAAAGSVEAQRAALNYWQARYEILTPLSGVTGERQAADPAVLLIATNAAFRAAAPEFTNPKVAVEKLDAVIQAYGDVLRSEPNNVDAAYNYEYVSKFRDLVARARVPVQKGQVALSVDLPVGPTIHGRPGGPPPEVAMKDFKTVQPLQSDERGEQIEVGRTPVTRRKG